MFLEDKSAEDTSEETPDTETPEGESSDSTDSEGEEDTQVGDQGKETKEEEGDTEIPEETLFFDPNKLPKELKGPFKRMQAAFTKKMGALSLSQRKAEAFDALASNPAFVEWIEANKEEDGAPSGKKKSGENGKTQDSTAQLIEEAVERALSRRDGKTTASQRIQDEFKQFVKDHPQWENYKEQMAPYIQQGYSMEDSFKLATYEDVQAIGSKKTLDKIKDKKNANVAKPGKVGTKETPVAKPKTVKEAYELAKKVLGQT